MRAPTLLVTLLVSAAAVPAAAGEVPATPPPTPVPPHGSPSPFPTTLETPEPSADPPETSAPSVALADLESGRILFERRAGRRRPIASTTKIMTALLVLEASRPFDEVVVSPNAAGQGGAVLGLVARERISVRDLLFALMLQSSNDAAVALAEHVAGDVGRFVRRMNRRARQLGLQDTRFASPNGLDDSGYSTARDLAVIAARAFERPAFADVVSAKSRRIDAPRGPPRIIQNRNALLWLYPDATGVKTGFTSAAGFCLVASAERDGLRLISVVLAAPREAFSDAAALLDHGFTAFERRALVDAGEPVGSLPVGGREVAVLAPDPLEAVVRRDLEVDLDLRRAPRVAIPVSPGERVGEVVAAQGGQEVARAPLVAAEAVHAEHRPTEPAAPLPMWRRAWASFMDLLARLRAYVPV